MAVDELGVVDIVGVEGSGDVVLTVSDHLEWDERGEHLLVLQEKLNRYLAFIESGELIEQYPAAIGRRVRIDVCCKYAPTSNGERFLQSACAVIERAGFSLSWVVLAS
jgi:hypothetical protein